MQAPSAQQAGDLFDRMISTATIPLEFKDCDRFSKLVMISRRTTSFANAIHRRFPNSVSISSREYEHYQIDEYPRKIRVMVDSVATNNHTTVGIPNAERAMVQPNDMFFVEGLFVSLKFEELQLGQIDPTGTTIYPPHLRTPTGARPVSIHYGTSFGPDGTDPTVFHKSYEQVKVLSVGDLDSAGLGFTLIRLQRCYSGPHANDWGGAYIWQTNQGMINSAVNTNNAGAIINGQMSLLRALPVFPEGSDSPYGRTKNPERKIDFTQEFKYALEWTQESVNHKSKLPMTQLQIAQKIQTMVMADDYEKAAILGRKGRNDPTLGGKTEMTLGGLLEFIPSDAQHQLSINAGTMNYSNWLDVTSRVADLGGSTTWDLYIGRAALNSLKKSFYNDGHMWFNKDESKKFDIPVETIVGAGNQLNLIPVRILDEIGLGNVAIGMDRAYPIMTPLTYNGWDMKADKDAANPGTTMEKEVYTSIKGFARMYDQYTCCIKFNNI